MIKFTVQISIPGYLDAEDELSNLLQGEGEEEDFGDAVVAAAREWIAIWLPHVRPCRVKVEVKQE